jgi:hypothetical protein
MSFQIKLNKTQRFELGKTFLDAGKFVFLGTGVAYFLPSLAQNAVSTNGLVGGLILALIFFTIGVTLLSREE